LADPSTLKIEAVTSLKTLETAYSVLRLLKKMGQYFNAQCSGALLLNSVGTRARVLRRISGPKRDEVTGESRKLHNEELNGLYSLPKVKG
jgi:hypothetical protein